MPFEKGTRHYSPTVQVRLNGICFPVAGKQPVTIVVRPPFLKTMCVLSVTFPLRSAAWRLLCLEQMWRMAPSLRQDWILSFPRRSVWQQNRTLATAVPSDIKRSLWLPVIANAVRQEDDLILLETFADWPLPARLPPAAVPWLAILTRVWEQHRTERDEYVQAIALRALVRLDRLNTISRLPEWLAEARQVIALKRRHPAYLAALACWQPPGKSLAGVNPSLLYRDWKDFWEELRAQQSGILQALAVQALLNLADAGTDGDGPPPEGLLMELAEHIGRIPQYDLTYLTVWQPSPETDFPCEAMQLVASAWLRQAQNLGKDQYFRRAVAWQTLFVWNRVGWLSRLGIDLLTPLDSVLRQQPNMAHILSQVTPPPETDPKMQNGWISLAAGWEQLTTSPDPNNRCAGWQGRIHLVRSGILPPEAVARFQADLLAAIGRESNPQVRLELAGWFPPGHADPVFRQTWTEAWARRLDSPTETERLAAFLALSRHWQFVLEALDPEDAIGWWRTSRRFLREICQLLSATKMVAAGDWMPRPVRLKQIVRDLAAGREMAESSPSEAEQDFHLLRLPAAQPSGRQNAGQTEGAQGITEQNFGRVSSPRTIPPGSN